MGTALAGLLILSVMISSMLILWRVDLFGNDLVGTAQKQMIQLRGEQARTEIDVTNVGKKSCKILVVSLLNEGHTSVSKSEFPKMDVIMHYPGTYLSSQTLTYEPLGEASLDAGEWVDLSISGPFDPSIWNPGETLKIGTPLESFIAGVSGTVVVSTPNGKIDTHIISFLLSGPGCEWYFHSETTNVGGGTYYQLKEGSSADGVATTISAPISAAQTGRIRPTANSGKFVYPLTDHTELEANDWDVTYRVQRDLIDLGFVWSVNAADISLGTTDSWQDIDISAYVPVGATGAVVEVVQNQGSDNYSGVVRATEDTRNYMSSAAYEQIQNGTHRWQIVKVDSSRKIQGYIESTGIDFKLLGYTIGSDPAYIISGTVTPDITPGTAGSWQTVNVSAYVDADADGVILLVDSVDPAVKNYSIREIGSSESFTDRALFNYGNTMYLVGINGSDQFQAWIEDLDVHIYLVAQTKGSVVYYTNDVLVTDPSTGSWQELDADTYSVSAAANGLVFHAENNGKANFEHVMGFRHGDSTDISGPGRDLGGETHFQAAVGIRDSDNVWDEYIAHTDNDVYIAAYTRLVRVDVHADIDIIIRQADGTIRSTLASNVVNSSNITTDTWTTFTVTYAFPGYTVVDPTDYLEIDLFADATSNLSGEAVAVDFRIDDLALPNADQMKILEVVP